MKEYEDIGKWPTSVQNSLRLILVKMGPIQPNISDHDYPKNLRYNNRRFTSKYYEGKKWLVYSVSTDKVYCFACKIFNKNTTLVKGYGDWIHLSQTLHSHEKSKEHKECLANWVKLLNENLKTVNELFKPAANKKLRHLKEIIEAIVHSVSYLASEGIAFRGTHENLFEPDNGHFLKLVEFLSKFHLPMKKHLENIEFRKKNGEKHVITHLSNRSQNQVLEILSNEVISSILKDLSKNMYYSIIADCTRDITHHEQFSIVVRFVCFDEENHKFEIRENFLGFVEVTDTTGVKLFEDLKLFLASKKLDIKMIRGQGYDNGSNMKGCYQGLQAKLKEVNPCAFYTPCSIHSLNLVAKNLSENNLSTHEYFALLQNIYVFFSESPKRNNIMESQVTLTIKGLCETRFEARTNAIRPFKENLNEIVLALERIYQDKNMNLSVQSEAGCYLEKITSFEFVCKTVILHDIFQNITLVSKYLQNPSLDLQEGLKKLKH